MHKVPFARLAMLLVLVLAAFANSYAQGACEAPGEFDFGVQVCPNGQGWAVSRYGPPPSYAWDTYQWTVTGGTITSDPNGSSLSYIAGPGGTVEITLTVSGNGCSGTKTHTAIVTPQRDALIESDSRVCPTGRSTASVMYPAANYSWSITNGTFVRPPNGWNVEFIAGESGVVTLDVVATDSTEGCEATGHLEIPIVGPATSILTDSVVCPTSLAWASLMADGMFAGGTYWWTAQNAHIVGSATSPSIQFMPDGTGPVTLSVTGSAGSGCSLSATQTIPVQPQIVPQLSANAETVCPSGQVTFNIANWSELASYRWEIVGATPVGNVVGGIAVTPSSGSTSVKVTASGMSAGGCETSASATVPVATPDATVWAPASVCPNSTFTASVADAGEGATYSWVAGGDGLLLSTNGREATFRINSGPMQARVTVASATGCSIPGEAVVSSGAALTPAIRAELPSCSSAGTASVDNTANYASVQWTIANGAFDGPSSGPSVNFHATSTAAVTLTANVSDGGSCSGSASVQVSQQTPTLPVITTTATRFCATGQRATAQVANSGSFRGIDWTLTNAVIVNRSPADNSIEYRSIAEGPVALSVSATDANGCPVSATMSVPYQPLQVPVISAPAEHCGVGSQFNVELTNADLFEQGTITSFNWAVRNGYVVGSYGRYATIQVTSSTNPVEIMVEVANYECRSTATATVAPRSGAVTPPPITFPLAEICPTSSMSASVPDGYMNYNWTIQNGSIYSGGGSTIWFTANGNGPVKLSVTMQSTTGCPVTSTATVPLKVTAPPVISFEKPNVCPNGPGTAWTDGYHASYVWSIVNGTFSSPTSSNFVSYTANGNGPVQLTVRVSEYDGCSATATNAQPLREALPPVITFEKPTVCPNGPGTAWTDGSWAGYTWSIVNGTFTSPTSSNFVTYMANGNGPVELTVHTWTSEFCNASAKNSQPLRETLPPVITFEKPNVCPNGPGVAWTDGSWAGYTWSIVNGTFTSPTSSNFVTYMANGNGPVELTVYTWTDEFCNASAKNSQPLREALPPVITFEKPNVCPNGPGVAWTDGSWAGYTWSIVNGTFTSPTSSNFVTYMANGNGPVELTVHTWTSEFCNTSVKNSQPLRETLPPVITFEKPNVCPGGPGTASAVGDWAGYTWSIRNGTFTSPTNSNAVSYMADGNGPVELTLQTWTAEFCNATATSSQPLRQTLPPVITFDKPAICPNSSGAASAAGDWAGYTWTIRNGTITSATNGNSVTYTADGSGPVELTLQTWTAEFCNAMTTAAQPLASIPPPVISAGSAALCPGATGTAAVTGEFAGYSWSITNGTFVSGRSGPSVTFTAGSSGAVQLSVQVWNADSCANSSSATVAIRDVAPIAISASGPTTFCAGGSVTLAAGNAASYQWSNGATTQSITVTAAGAYSVTAVDANGCTTSSAPLQVTVDPALSATITSAAAICEGSSGTASVADAGAGAQYQWTIANGTMTSGNGTASIVFAASGSAPVQLGVTVSRGSCSATANASVAVNPRPLFSIIAASANTYELRDGGDESSMMMTAEESSADSTHLMCGTTKVSLRASVLDRNWTYSWSTGATGPLLTVTEGGSYTLTATNAAGCTWSETAEVVIRPAPVATISGPSSFCPGGSVTLTAAGGDSYLWSTGATTPSIAVNSAGTYSVQVTKDGCTATASKPVTQAAAGISADGPTTFCHGGTVTLTASTAQSYLWSNGATTRSITVTASGTFTVQETFDSCTLTSDPIAVTVGPASVSIALDDNSVCPNQTIHFTSTVTGGTNLTYQWLDGTGNALGNGATLDFVPQQPGYGTVSLRVADANGCAVTSPPITYYRYDTPKPAITPLGPTTFCDSGNVTLEAPPASSYLWSTGATTRSITAWASGTFRVTITDGSGCTLTSDPLSVTALPRPPQPTITASGPLTFCEGGSVTLTAPDGYPSYHWSTGETTKTITVSTTRNVALTVINAAGCDNTSDVQVTVNPLPAATITASGPTTFCEGGSVTLTAPAGYAYAWSNGATARSITVAASGTYAVTVTNANGCSASASTSVTVNPLPSTPTITASGPLTFCEGGSVTLTAPAGYAYAWSNGATARSITVAASGTYTVTVTNANGCSASASTSVTVNPLPSTPTITASGQLTFCEGGSVTLTAPAGYAYAWSNGATTRSITAAATGAYRVTVTNASGCSATSAATNVTVNPKPATPTITASGPTALCPGASVTLAAPAGYTYAWSNGATTPSITVSTAGPYSVTVTNASGCSVASAPVVVTNNAPTVITTQPQSKTIARNVSTTLSVAAGGTEPLQYQWYAGTSGDTTQALAGQTSATVSVGPFSKKSTNRYWVRVWSSTCSSSAVNSTTAVVTVN